jgi:hypothetical protein
VALIGASVIAVTPVTPPPPEVRTVSAEVRLAAEPSIYNIPMNLFQDIINIPYNFVYGVNTTGQSLLFSGTWLMSSASNVWGTDPGDPAHYYGLAHLFPFPAFSEALAAQVSGVLAVLLPIHSACNDIACAGGVDMMAGWYRLDRIWDLLEDGKFTFDEEPVEYPDGSIHPPEGIWNSSGPVNWGAQYGHPEWDTVDGPNGDPVVPWAGTTFTFDPFSPFTNYWITHLMSDPTSDENAIKFPTLQETFTAFTNLAAGLFVAFSPFFPGSPWCFGLCGPLSDLEPPFWHEEPPTTWPPVVDPATTAPQEEEQLVQEDVGPDSVLEGSVEEENRGLNALTVASDGPLGTDGAEDGDVADGTTDTTDSDTDGTDTDDTTNTDDPTKTDDTTETDETTNDTDDTTNTDDTTETDDTTDTTGTTTPAATDRKTTSDGSGANNSGGKEGGTDGGPSGRAGNAGSSGE